MVTERIMKKNNEVLFSTVRMGDEIICLFKGYRGGKNIYPKFCLVDLVHILEEYKPLINMINSLKTVFEIQCHLHYRDCCNWRAGNY